MMNYWHPGSGVYWLPVAIFIMHIAEEAWLFPRWASRHFAPTSQAFYVYSHMVLVTIFVAVAYLAGQARSMTFWPWFSLAIQWGLFSNFLFHAVTTIAFRSYSPGVVTASAFFPLATVLFLHEAINERLLTPVQVASSLLAGSGMGVAVVAALLIPTDIRWRIA